jgi:hypothetical protein
MTAVERITNGEQRRWEHKLFTIERTGEHILTRFKVSATATAILARGNITTQLADNGWKRCDSTTDEVEGWLTTLWQRA